MSSKRGVRKLEHRMAEQMVTKGEAPDKRKALAMIRKGTGAHSMLHRRTGCRAYLKNPHPIISTLLNVAPLSQRKRRRKRNK